MHVYLAGSSGEIEDVERNMAALRAAGVEITCDWCAAIREAGDANPRYDAALRLSCSQRDLEGVFNADIFWLMVPGEKGSAGAYVELGYAITMEHARIVVSGDYRKCIFTSMSDNQFDTHEEALAFIIEQAKPVLNWKLTFKDGASFYVHAKTADEARALVEQKQAAGDIITPGGKNEITLQSLGPVEQIIEAPPLETSIIENRKAPGA